MRYKAFRDVAFAQRPPRRQTHMSFRHPVSSLRGALSDAGVKGRSAAKSRGELERLCAKNGLLGLKIDENDKVALAYEVPELPDDVLVTVCMRVAYTAVERLEAMWRTSGDAEDEGHHQAAARVLAAAESTTKTLMTMHCSSRIFAETLEPDAEPWRRLLDVFATCSNLHGREARTAQALARGGQLTPKRALELVACTGCELCRINGIRKVYWPFRWRCCQDCLRGHTISTYRLTRDFGVKDEQLRHLPSMEVEMYRPQVGSFTCTFVKKKDAVPVLSEHYAMGFGTLADAYAHVQWVEAEAEMRKAEAERARTEPVRAAARALLVGWPEEEVREAVRKASIKNATRVNVVARNLAVNVARGLLRTRATRTLPAAMVQRAAAMAATAAGESAGAGVSAKMVLAQRAVETTSFDDLDVGKLLSNAIEDADVEEIAWPSFAAALARSAADRARPAQTRREPARTGENRQIIFVPMDCPKCTRKGLKGAEGLRQHMRDVHGA